MRKCEEKLCSEKIELQVQQNVAPSLELYVEINFKGGLFMSEKMLVTQVLDESLDFIGLLGWKCRIYTFGRLDQYS